MRTELFWWVALLAPFLVICAGVFAVVSDGLSKVHQGYAEYQENARRIEEAAKQDIEKSCFTNEFATYSKCIREKLDAYYEAQATNQDLQAQQDMAYWAGALLLIGFVQIGLGVLGIFFVKWNLAAVRETNRIAFESSQQQLRAYVFVTRANCRIDNNRTPHFSINIKNTGHTPAWGLSVATAAKLLPFPTEQEFKLNKSEISGTLGPDGEIAVSIETEQITAASLAAIASGQEAFYVVGRIEYVDVFRRHQWMTFRVFHGGKGGPSSDGAMYSDRAGNDASR
jgi:hypothetical protein